MTERAGIKLVDTDQSGFHQKKKEIQLDHRPRTAIACVVSFTKKPSGASERL